MRRALAVLAVVLVAACGGDGADTEIAGATFTVHAKDNNKFDKSSYTAKAGPMTIGYQEDGQLVHTLLIEGQPDFKLAVARNVTTASGTVTLTPGTYTLFCDVPGHREDGMVATLKVE
jgi:plastocyanin